MMARFLPIALAAGVLSGSALAQQSSTPQPVTSQVKNAGTLHLATGTWTRGASQVALAGPQVLYDNTCTVGFFSGSNVGQELLDSGRIPSTSSPANGVSLNGLADSYQVQSFDIGYCSVGTLAPTVGIAFYDCFSACSGTVASSPAAVFTLVNLPGAAGASSTGCWIMTIDLSNTTLDFPLRGDCDGVYDGVPALDDFGWSWSTLAPASATLTGPILAGDPLGLFNTGCGSWGDGTTFPGSNPSAPGTGIGTVDQFESAPAAGCFSFGGYSSSNPFSSFYFRMSGDADVVIGSSAYCLSDGSGGTCPCGNFGSAGQGCGNSAATEGARLGAAGTPSISNDTIQFGVSGAPANKPGLLLRGINQVSMPMGDGLLCTAGQGGRSQVQMTSAAGTANLTNDSGSPFGQSSYGPGIAANYQFWFRDPQFVCTGAGFNYTNAWSLVWAP